MATLQLGNTIVTKSGDEVYTIAEIGQNHQGNIEIAKQMIMEAKKIGCNCVKLQKSCLSAKFTRSALNRAYDNVNSWGKTYGQHKEYLEFPLELYKELQKFCNRIGIDFTASAMDEISLDDLNALNVPFIKIGSGDADNFLLLRKAAKLKCPLVISTGMQTMATIDHIVDIMQRENKTNYALLHCVSSYPTEPADCTLSIIPILMQRFPNLIIGYSGHEKGIDISKAAVLLGAKIVERHFTLDKKQKGWDHMCSLEPSEFRRFVQDIQELRRNCVLQRAPFGRHDILKILHEDDLDQLALALRVVEAKTILPCELACKQKLGKSAVATRNLPADHRLQRNDICVKVSEPNGISAQYIDSILGAKLNSNVAYDNPIMESHISDFNPSIRF